MRKVLTIIFCVTGWAFADQVQITSPLPLPVSGSFTANPSTATSNVVSTYTVITSTYPINVAGTFTAAASTATANVQSTYTVVSTTYPISVSVSGTVPVSGTFFQSTQPVSGVGTFVVTNSTNPLLVTSTGTQAISGSISNTGFNVNNTPAVTQSGSWVFQPLGITTVTHNNIGQPVTSTYTVVSTTYPISVSASFTPPAITTVSWVNQGAQNILSTYTVISDTYSLPVSATFTPPAVTTVSWANQGAQSVISTYTVISTTYPILVSVPAITTVSWANQGAQSIISTYTVFTDTYSVPVNATFTPPAITTVSWANQGAQNVVSTSVVITGTLPAFAAVPAVNATLQNGVSIDSGAFNLGVTSITIGGGVYIPNPSALLATSTTTAVSRINKFRSQYVTLMDDNGVILGTSTTNPIYHYQTNVSTVFPSGVFTVQPIGVTTTTLTQSTIGVQSVGALTVQSIGVTTVTVTASTVGVVQVTNPWSVQPIGITTATIIQSTIGVISAAALTVQPIGITTTAVQVLIASTTIPGAAANASTATMLANGWGMPIVSDVPEDVVSSTWNVNITTNTELILISSAAAGARTRVCGCNFKNTTATVYGFNLYQSSSNIVNPFYPIEVPATSSWGVRRDCTHPFFWSVPGGQITIKGDAVNVSSVSMNCQYWAK